MNPILECRNLTKNMVIKKPCRALIFLLKEDGLSDFLDQMEVERVP